MGILFVRPGLNQIACTIIVLVLSIFHGNSPSALHAQWGGMSRRTEVVDQDGQPLVVSFQTDYKPDSDPELWKLRHRDPELKIAKQLPATKDDNGIPVGLTVGLLIPRDHGVLRLIWKFPFDGFTTKSGLRSLRVNRVFYMQDGNTVNDAQKSWFNMVSRVSGVIVDVYKKGNAEDRKLTLIASFDQRKNSPTPKSKKGVRDAKELGQDAIARRELAAAVLAASSVRTGVEPVKVGAHSFAKTSSFSRPDWYWLQPAKNSGPEKGATLSGDAMVVLPKSLPKEELPDGFLPVAVNEISPFQKGSTVLLVPRAEQFDVLTASRVGSNNELDGQPRQAKIVNSLKALDEKHPLEILFAGPAAVRFRFTETITPGHESALQQISRNGFHGAANDPIPLESLRKRGYVLFWWD